VERLRIGIRRSAKNEEQSKSKSERKGGNAFFYERILITIKSASSRQAQAQRAHRALTN
jgi:hypothetical protein